MQFDEHLSDVLHGFYWHGASRGPLAIAQFVVQNNLVVSRWSPNYVMQVPVTCPGQCYDDLTLITMRLTYFYHNSNDSCLC